MQRTYRKADHERDKAAAQAKYEKKYDGTGIQPVQKRSVAAGAAAYREQEAYRIEREEARERKRAEEEAEKQAFIAQIASVQDDEDALTPADIFEFAETFRSEGDCASAIDTYWQALVCGNAKAAFPLFEILRDGESGINQNMEMAGIFFYLANKCRDTRCHTTPKPKQINFDAAKEIFAIAVASREFIVNPGYKITQEIAQERQAAANEALDGFDLHTRSTGEAMIDVFQHDYDFTFDDDIALAGASTQEDHQDHGSKKCILM